MSPGNGVCPGERLVARVVAWRVAKWHRRQTQIRLAESPRIPSSKSVEHSRSCTISRSPSQIGETERCYLVVGLGNYPQAEGTRPSRRVWHTRPMNTPVPPNRYKNHRFPPEIISHAVWLYFRFCLSYRDVEELMAERGVILTYEAVR